MERGLWPFTIKKFWEFKRPEGRVPKSEHRRIFLNVKIISLSWQALKNVQA
jgi:hypothetical protein